MSDAPRYSTRPALTSTSSASITSAIEVDQSHFGSIPRWTRCIQTYPVEVEDINLHVSLQHEPGQQRLT